MTYPGRVIERNFYYGAGCHVLEKARLLRKNMTDCEKILWNHLRKKRLSGNIFRRQHPISQFIVDFYCHEAKLVVEVDGKIHDNVENKEYDEGRTFELEKFGLKVLRFKNEEIKYHIRNVIKIIDNEINARVKG